MAGEACQSPPIPGECQIDYALVVFGAEVGRLQSQRHRRWLRRNPHYSCAEGGSACGGTCFCFKVSSACICPKVSFASTHSCSEGSSTYADACSNRWFPRGVPFPPMPCQRRVLSPPPVPAMRGVRLRPRLLCGPFLEGGPVYSCPKGSAACAFSKEPAGSNVSTVDSPCSSASASSTLVLPTGSTSVPAPSLLRVRLLRNQLWHKWLNMALKVAKPIFIAVHKCHFPRQITYCPRTRCHLVSDLGYLEITVN